VIRVPDSESPDTEEELLMIRRSEKMWNPGAAEASARARSVPKDGETENYVSNTSPDYEELLIRQVRPKLDFDLKICSSTRLDIPPKLF